jgi:hypothetical protein
MVSKEGGEYKVEYQINAGGFSLPPENLEEQCFGLGAPLKLAHVRLRKLQELWEFTSLEIGNCPKTDGAHVFRLNAQFTVTIR